jgi:hypothetical protein
MTTYISSWPWDFSFGHFSCCEIVYLCRLKFLNAKLMPRTMVRLWIPFQILRTYMVVQWLPIWSRYCYAWFYDSYQIYEEDMRIGCSMLKLVVYVNLIRLWLNLKIWISLNSEVETSNFYTIIFTATCSMMLYSKLSISLCQTGYLAVMSS